MLDDLKSIKVYQALKNSGGLSSPAAAKAAAAKATADDIGGQLESLSNLPKDGEIGSSGLPAMVPPEIRDAADKLQVYKSSMGSTSSAASSLSGAIGERMEDATGNMAIMNAAVGVANKMGEVEGGCGPIGAAFAVLTSQGRTELLQSMMDSMKGPLGELQTLFAKYMGGAGMLSPEDKAKLAALMAELKGAMASIEEATAGIRDLVNEAQAMWGSLQDTLKRAIQASTLMAALNNPCMRAVADSIVPDNVRDVLDSFDD